MRGVALTICAAASACMPAAFEPGEAPIPCDPPASSRLGLNAYHLVRAELGAAEGDVDAALAEARLSGAGAIRIWLFDVERSGEWFAAVDAVLDAAEAAGLGVVGTLSNFWPDYGGLLGRPDVDVHAFFTDSQAEARWREEVGAVVRRARRRSSIIAWELMNEPRCPHCDPRVLDVWLARQRRFVRSLDPDTPVWDGHEGWRRGAGWGVDRAGSLHVYPQREAGPTAAEQVAAGRRRIAQAGRRAAESAIPWVLGEIGWRYDGCPGDDPDCSRSPKHLERNDAQKALSLGVWLEEATSQGADRVFVWRLAEPSARDWDHYAVTPSRMPRTQVALCEAAHLLGPG